MAAGISKNPLAWKYLGEFNSKTEISITNIDFSELYLYPYAGTYGASILVRKDSLESTIKRFVCGGSLSTSNVFGFSFQITTAYIKLTSAYSGGAGDTSDTAKFKVYYR